MTGTFLLGGDLSVNRLGFGAMRLCRQGPGGPPRNPERGRAVLSRAVELGVNHIDTAAFYATEDGIVRANDLIRDALHPYPPGLVIATKVGPIFGPDGPRQGGPDSLRAAVENNLESLAVGRLDLVYLRIGMREIPHGESLAERFEVLAGLREEGLIHHLALSNVDTAHLEEARAIAPVAAVQNHFHLAKQDELAVLEVCAAGGIGFAPYFPLAGGGAGINDDRLMTVAARQGATPSQIALAWLLALSPVALAIPGTGSLDHLEENVAASSITLTPEDRAALV